MATPHEYAAEHASDFEQQLFDWLKIPSVSTDMAFADDVLKAAEWLKADFERIGLTTEIMPTDRHPMVYAEWMGAGDDAPTVLVYGHYDVQPAVKEDGWDTDPFEPTVKDGKVYARGATDDKGQTFTHVKAVESLLATVGALPVNVKFIIEGEEESGSRGIAQLVMSKPDKLKADVCVISDTGMYDINQPMIVYGLRGGAALEVTVRGPKNDLHSGMYGGAVHNPAQALAEILAQLHDKTGRITVPGFYDDVKPLTPQERDASAAIPWSEEKWREETGAPKPWGEPDYTPLERMSARPTLEITGMASGYFGSGMKSIVPEKAWAKILCRLVPDQDPEKIAQAITDYIETLTPDTVQVEVQSMRGTPAVIVSLDNPMMQAAVSAYSKGWGAEPIFRREGGSIPIVSGFQNVLGMPVILLGFGLNTDNLHAPNEHFTLSMFHKGVQTVIHFLYEVAKVGRG